ncbi:MAG: YjjG family noncanonical pyrimidine nucleotidase [Spirochaetales bacterium]|nr:YjjG family noncanonical pyrimidine nucleotidase [Spirochaetales bacterium]
MKKYEFLLFDADNTLLDFDENERVSLLDTFEHFGLPCTEEVLGLYHEINIMYWEMLSRKEIERDALLIKRFETLFERVGIKADPVATENHYRTNLGNGCQIMEGAMEVLMELKKDYKLYVITNGVAKTQHNRLEKSGLAELMEDIFISDEIGYNKPDREFFEYVESHIPCFEHEKALVIGDSLFSDIRGGVEFGLDTCYLNIYHKPNTSEIISTYEIQDIVELPQLLKNTAKEQ